MSSYNSVSNIMGDKPTKGQPTLPDGMLPKHVLHELSEHTIGGFAIFYFNSETGYPQHILSFDSPAHCLAMQKYMHDWAVALQAIHVEGNKASIIQSFHRENPE